MKRWLWQAQFWTFFCFWDNKFYLIVYICYNSSVNKVWGIMTSYFKLFYLNIIWLNIICLSVNAITRQNFLWTNGYIYLFVLLIAKYLIAKCLFFVWCSILVSIYIIIAFIVLLLNRRENLAYLITTLLGLLL